MGPLVIKFGGTSVGSADALGQAAGIALWWSTRLMGAEGDFFLARKLRSILAADVQHRYPEKVRAILGGYTG